MKPALTSCAAAGVCAVLLAAAPAGAHPVAGNLPGGTSISVSVDSPADATVLTQGPVTVTGTAAIGQGQPVPTTAIIYALDISGTTNRAGGCAGDQDGDGTPDEILDCEIGAARQFNAQVLAPGVAGTVAEVGAVGFADGAVIADVGPGAGDQVITDPAADEDGAGGPDIEQALSSAFNFPDPQAGFTSFARKAVPCCTSSFASGVRAATTVAAAADPGLRTVVLFMAEDVANAGEDAAMEAALAAVPDDVEFRTFGIGPNTPCTDPRNHLQQIADATGGQCTQVTDLAELPDVVSGVVGSELSSLSVRVDGGIPGAVTDVTPALPQDGPASVHYTTTVPLGPGRHEVCVSARGSDARGAGEVSDCHTVVAHRTAEAFAVQASGLVTIAKTPHATCPPGGVLTVAALDTALASVEALNASCVVDADTGTVTAASSVDGARLLAGLVTVTGIDSTCVAGADGTSSTSSVGTVNGVPVGTAPATITIPGVAQVLVNETTTNASGHLVRNALRVRTVLGQQIVLAGCRLT